MTDAEAYTGLTEVFNGVFGDGVPTLTPAMTANDVPGWDSVKMVMIMLAVEQHFGIKIRSREVDRLKNVGDLAQLVKAKKAA